jgi:hypothetical protein
MGAVADQQDQTAIARPQISAPSCTRSRRYRAIGVDRESGVGHPPRERLLAHDFGFGHGASAAAGEQQQRRRTRFK